MNAPRQNLKLRLLLVGIVITIGITIATRRYNSQLPIAFVQEWKGRFMTVDSLDKAIRMATTEHAFVRQLPSGEWFIAICEHSCCSGRGFDATVIRDSAGEIYVDTTHSFCGMEGLSDELQTVAADSLSLFYKNVRQLHLIKQ